MREFIPGPCGMGSPEEIELFELADGPEPSEVVVAAAQTICGACVQLSHCEEQREGIATELTKRGAIEPVVGGQKIQILLDQPLRQPTVRMNALREPAFTFNIYAVPAEISPRGLLQTIRQGFRAKQLPVTRGKTGTMRERLRPHLDMVSVPEELSEDVRLEAMSEFAVMFMMYRTKSMKPWKVNNALTDEEIARAKACFLEFSTDAVEITKDGGPIGFLKYHEPTLYGKLLEESVSERGLQKALVRRIVNKSAYDPITRLLNRQAAMRATQRQEVPSALRNTYREIVEAEADAPAQLQEFAARFTALTEAFPEIPVRVCRYISRNYRNDYVEAMTKYAAAYASLCVKYKDDPLAPDAVLSDIVLRNAADPEPVVKAWYERSVAYRNLAQEKGFRYTEGVIGRIAFEHAETLSAEEFQRALNRATAIRLRKTCPLIDVEDLVTLAILYPEKQERRIAASSLSNLLHRELITKEGDTWQWTQGADFLTESERQAILCVTGLDLQIYGSRFDRETLKQTLGVDDLDALVQYTLVPHILPPSKHDVIGHIRYRAFNMTLPSSAFTFAPEDIAALQEVFDQYFEPGRSGLSHEAELVQSLQCRMLEAFSVKELLGWVGGRRLAAMTDAYLKACTVLPKASRLARLPEGGYEELIAYDGGLPIKRTNDVMAAVTSANEPLRRLRELKQNMRLLQDAQFIAPLSPSLLSRAAVRYSHAELPMVIENIRVNQQRYNSHAWAPKSGVSEICIKAGTKQDPREIIDDRIRIAHQADRLYGHRIERANIIVSSFDRADPLAFFARTIRRMDKLAERYGDRHDVDEYVLYRAAESANPERWITDYFIRYESALSYAQPSHSPAVIRRIVATNVKPDAVRWAIKGYDNLRKVYEVDSYIVPSMVDDAVRWDLKSAKLALRRIRSFIASGSMHVSFVEEPKHPHEHATYWQQQSQTEVESPEQIVMARTEHAENDAHKTIATALRGLTALEKAAVLHVYGLPWLIVASNDDEYDYTDPMIVMHQLGIQEAAGLHPYVAEEVLPKISPTIRARLD